MNERPRATIEDVAKYAGVSTATVSRVMNQSGKVAAKTARKVEMAMATLKYVPSATAQGLARHKTNTLGVVMPSFGTPFLLALLQGISQGSYDAGLSLLVHAQYRPNAFQAGVSCPIGEHNIDGLIIFSGTVDEALLLYLYERRFPTVLLYQRAPAIAPVPSLLIDNYGGSYAAVEHLILHCRRRRIAFLCGPPGNGDAQDRHAGYRAALDAYHIALDPMLIGSGDFSEHRAEATVSQWLADGVTFDAIYTGDDNAAVGAIRALQAAGHRVPHDVAVVGFNDDDLSHLPLPPLTTVRAPTIRMGYSAIHHLVQMMAGKGVEQLVTLPTALVIRDSCGSRNSVDCNI
ncbi:MAG: LacI family DNA-binding transcriptional regulator [Caldilineaceae bacterium]